MTDKTFDAKIYAERRQTLCNTLGKCIIFLMSAPVAMINDDCEHQYRQDSTFYYYTGFTEEHAAVIIDNSFTTYSKPVYEMFVKERDLDKEMITGERCGLNEARSIYGADIAFPLVCFGEELSEIIEENEKIPIYHSSPNNASHILLNYLKLKNINFEENKSEEIKLDEIKLDKNKSEEIKLEELRPIADCLRLIKSQEEIELLKKANDISGRAHIELMKTVKPGMNERELSALFTYIVSRDGCDRLAYPNIVAGGNNATTIHYGKNNAVLKDGDLLLVDAGGEYDYYVSDITRTYPINGKFSEPQKEIYSIVLDAQKTCIDMVKSGISRKELTSKTDEILTSGLIKLGILKGTLSENLQTKTFKRFYPHSFGHYVGLDVHDCMKFSDWRNSTLYSGYVTTVEPGIYISASDETVEEKYRGIGIRIEDDILVTENGYINLTESVPKEIEEIENLMKK